MSIFPSLARDAAVVTTSACGRDNRAGTSVASSFIHSNIIAVLASSPCIRDVLAGRLIISVLALVVVTGMLHLFMLTSLSSFPHALATFSSTRDAVAGEVIISVCDGDVVAGRPITSAITPNVIACELNPLSFARDVIASCSHLVSLSQRHRGSASVYVPSQS